MKLLIAALATACLVPRADTLAFSVQKGAQIAKKLETSLELEARHVSISIDGNEQPEEEMKKYELSMANTIELAVEDEYSAIEEGRPTALVRRFQTVKSRLKTHDQQPGRKPVDKDETFESPLGGKAVEFEWDPKDDSWQRSIKGDEIDKQSLEKLKADMDFLSLLHPGSLAEGAQWKIDPKRVGELIKPGGELPFPQQKESNLHVDFTSNASGTIEATFAGTRAVEGRKLGLIKLEVRVKSTQPADPEQPLSFALAGTLELDGEYLWDLERGRLASYTIHGPIGLVATSEREFQGKDKQGTMKLRFEFAGKLEAKGAFE